MKQPILARLYTAVRQAFIDDRVVTPNEFGWRAPSYQTREILSRVCWVPGDATTGDAGEIGAAFRPGRGTDSGRPLDSFFDLFTVYCYATHPSEDLTNEFAQYVVVKQLFDYFYNKLYLAAYDIGLGKRFDLRKAGWVNDKKERPHGATIRLLFRLQDNINDDADVFADATTHGIFQTGLETSDGEGHTTITSDGPVDIEPGAEE